MFALSADTLIGRKDLAGAGFVGQMDKVLQRQTADCGC